MCGGMKTCGKMTSFTRTVTREPREAKEKLKWDSREQSANPETYDLFFL